MRKYKYKCMEDFILPDPRLHTDFLLFMLMTTVAQNFIPEYPSVPPVEESQRRSWLFFSQD